VLRQYADVVIEGIAAAVQLVGAGRAVLGIKEKYRDVIDLLRPKLPQGIEVAPLQDAYPAGDEFILVYDVLGRWSRPGASIGRRRGGDQRRDGPERRSCRRSARHGKIPLRRRCGGRAGNPAGAGGD